MDVNNKEQVVQTKRKGSEKALLKQMAKILVKEGLINYDEQIRFLAILKEEK